MSTVQALSAPQGLSMPTAKKIFAFASMCVGMFIALIDIQIVSASLRDIGGGLSAGDDETVWVQTSYLIAEIIIIPLSGWLARVMSTRWLFAASAAGFTLMSLLCGWAWNIQSMIAFRALQGLAGGSMIPLVFTTAFAFFQGKQRVIAAATIGGLASLAPTLGPTVGGWITENYNWHWLFFINVVPGIYIAVAVPLLVKVDSADPTLLRGADYLSILLLALSLGCLEYTLEEGPRWGWFDDATLTTTAWVALLCGVAFVIRTLRHPQPVMDLRALQDRTFSLGCYFSFMAGVGIFATIYLTPLYLGERARFQCAGDRPGGIFHRSVPGHVYSVLFVARQPRRSALAADGRADRLCGVNVQLCSDHSRLGGGPVAAPAGLSRTSAAVCRRANGDPDAGQPAARAPEAGLRAV